MKIRHISRRIRRFTKANEAVSALEYAILVGVITIGVGAAIAAFSKDVSDAIAAIGDGIGVTITETKGGKNIDADNSG